VPGLSQLSDKLLRYTGRTFALAFEFVLKMTEVKNICDVTKPQTEFIQAQVQAMSELVSALGETATKRALAKATSAPYGCGRLIFAIDATGSRERSWDLACQAQGEMFEEAARTGALSIQLVYYRGMRECQASRWAADDAHSPALWKKSIVEPASRTSAGCIDHVWM